MKRDAPDRLIRPDAAEDARIDAAVRDDPDADFFTEDDFARARTTAETPEAARVTRRGRPKLPEHAKKKRVTLNLDPDVVEALKAEGEQGYTTRANALLRAALGLD